MTSHSSSNHSSASLVCKLVCHLMKKPSESVKSEYRDALYTLNCSATKCEKDELSTCEKIKAKLISQKKTKDAMTFVELHRKLQTSAILKNRTSVLYFLHSLQDFKNEEVNYCQVPRGLESNVSLDSGITLNAHDVINKQINKSHNNVMLGDLFIKAQSRDLSSDVQFPSGYKQCKNRENFDYIQNKVSGVEFAAEKYVNGQSGVKREKLQEKALIVRSNESNLGSISLTVPNLQRLLHDILYAVQGLRGDLISWDPEKNNFNVVFREDLPNPVKRLTLRFMELGWMYCCINQYCKVQSCEKSSGLIAQSFVSALKSKLVDYYKLIAELEAFLSQEQVLDNLYNVSNSLTLHRLSVWFFEPHIQLKVLASVVDACKGKKGGALASVLFLHVQHGNENTKMLIQDLLKVVTRPLVKMLSNWIYCGELEDVFGEFFVATNIAVPDCSLWQERYSLNKAMIPSFITMDQARKILSTGKAINFLRRVCQDNSFARDEKRRTKSIELMNSESLFSQEKDSNFESILEKNYTKTSKIVLQVLHEKYNLMDHLLAMRNYFLLGQGDFIRHLMDLLDVDLAKPGNSLYIHNLTGILESAIRATNAQFHNSEVLQRLDVRLLEVSVGDTGWDVFSLDYHVDGPISTVFTPHCMNSYARLFTTLWRAKRMEYILSKISQSRTTYLKLQAKIPAVTSVLHQCHIILAQMVHFVQQMQYYMAFEVMECCWADLLLKISSAKDLDQVISAHENFLDTLLTRALLDEESLILRTHLKAIYDLIIEFDKHQSQFWSEVKIAAAKKDEKEENIRINTEKNNWGSTDEQKAEFDVLVEHLKCKSIPTVRAELRILSNTYEDTVQKFLIMLNDQDDPNLCFLSFRLDFNEHFKNKNSRLQTSLTYQHRRKSIK
ncbi:gamma-tubulin complex component 3-like [Uloborus diversus]|uniref:gamma-tubulin complex component 3-like n=1 Tax=Uloborus diversus TaxID=327109 RepID=UPI002409F490|nr:gamma-tubulin complex component 3-like [Uloborus diversus]